MKIQEFHHEKENTVADTGGVTPSPYNDFVPHSFGRTKKYPI
jgi:hypothetical protein